MCKKALLRLIPACALFLGIAAGPVSAGSPVAGPLEVSVQSFTSQVAPGGAGHVGVAVENHSLRLTLHVALRVNIVYADGEQQNLLLDTPIVLQPEAGFVQVAFFPVPQDAAIGTATIRALAVLTFVEGPSSDAFVRPPPAIDQDTFAVVAAIGAGSARQPATPATRADRSAVTR